MRYRLDKFLSNFGCGSRKEVRLFIKKGHVTINGAVCKKADQVIDALKDIITFDERFIEYQPFIYLMMNKPSGYLSATTDNAQVTILDLINGYDHYDLFPVGRLDKDTTGLLLVSNDGELAHQLLSPKNHVAKIYEARLLKPIDESSKVLFEKGIVLNDGYQCLPASLVILEPTLIHLTIIEGKFHQVKRMFEALDNQVIALKRISFGALALDEQLKPGAYRLLTDDEIALLKGVQA